MWVFIRCFVSTGLNMDKEIIVHSREHFFMKIFGTYTMGLLQWCSGGASVVLWWCFGVALGVLWWCSGGALVLLWGCFGAALGVLQWCSGSALVVLRGCFVGALRLLWWFSGAALVVLWGCFSGTLGGLQGGSKGASFPMFFSLK